MSPTPHSETMKIDSRVYCRSNRSFSFKRSLTSLGLAFLYLQVPVTTSASKTTTVTERPKPPPSSHNEKQTTRWIIGREGWVKAKEMIEKLSKEGSQNAEGEYFLGPELLYRGLRTALLLSGEPVLGRVNEVL